MNQALIIGDGGQDGTLLYERLDRDGYELLGIGRGRSRSNLPSETGAAVDVLDGAALAECIRSFRPDAVYYLAAHHHSAEEATGDEATLYRRSHDVHVVGLVNLLEAVRCERPKARVFYAASSHCFGIPDSNPQNETTALRPFSSYGITKATGVHLCRLYRNDYGIHASCGFLYNHESPLRRPNFLSQKIVRSAVAIHHGADVKLHLGDLAARVDWGYAPDYIDAMIRIVGAPSADDFVVATSQSHSVRDFVESAFSHLDLDWRAHVEVRPAVVRKPFVELVGDSSRLRALTGWSPSVSFPDMVRLLVDAELKRYCDSGGA